MVSVESWEQPDFVARVKEIQRTDNFGKTSWDLFVDEFGGKVRDPNKHDIDFLQFYISRYESGLYAHMGNDEGGGGYGGGLVELFKEGQRSAPAFKQAWGHFRNGDLTDPTKAGKEALIAFLDFIGEQGMMALSLMDGLWGSAKGAVGGGGSASSWDRGWDDGNWSSGWQDNSGWGAKGGPMDTGCGGWGGKSGDDGCGWGGKGKGGGMMDGSCGGCDGKGAPMMDAGFAGGCGGLSGPVPPPHMMGCGGMPGPMMDAGCGGGCGGGPPVPMMSPPPPMMDGGCGGGCGAIMDMPPLPPGMVDSSASGCGGKGGVMTDGGCGGCGGKGGPMLDAGPGGQAGPPMDGGCGGIVAAVDAMLDSASSAMGGPMMENGSGSTAPLGGAKISFGIGGISMSKGDAKGGSNPLDGFDPQGGCNAKGDAKDGKGGKGGKKGKKGFDFFDDGKGKGKYEDEEQFAKRQKLREAMEKINCGDPVKDRLIAKLQNFLRYGEEQKKAWKMFVDHMDLKGKPIDPMEYSVELLTMFCEAYELL